MVDFLPFSSIYPSTTNTTKPILQINVIFEKNFILQIVGMK
jgi:hypothetical protein